MRFFAELSTSRLAAIFKEQKNPLNQIQTQELTWVSGCNWKNNDKIWELPLVFAKKKKLIQQRENLARCCLKQLVMVLWLDGVKTWPSWFLKTPIDGYTCRWSAVARHLASSMAPNCSLFSWKKITPSPGRQIINELLRGSATYYVLK